MTELPQPIVAPTLAAFPHGFSTREGGVSTGVVAGLQCGLGAGDDPEAVEENRRRFVQAVMPSALLLTPHQIHSADVAVVTAPFDTADRPKVDALVTATPSLLLGIVTADCAPVLLADEEPGVIGAAHAGWRGAREGVLENTVAAMATLGARRESIAAVVGPCIAQASYEVAEEMRAEFADEDARFFAAGRPGHYQFDLAAYAMSRLRACGVGSVTATWHDTYVDPAHFYSYRRATHRAEPAYGRQLSVIGVA